MRLPTLFLLVFLYSCNSLPREQFSPLTWDPPRVSYNNGNSTVEIHLTKSAPCPLLIDVNPRLDSANLESQLSSVFPLLMPPMMTDTVIRIEGNDVNGKSDLNWLPYYAHVSDTIQTDSFFLPYPYGRTYTIMQGYNGSYSHNNDGARYAIDFALQVGDTVCAAADGYVVGVIEGYEKGGNSSKWMDYANFINLYHPDKDVYTQYVHLRKNGSLVEVGDSVVAGQAIGISGATGWTSKPHLHFNVIRWENGKRISLPATFGQKFLTPGSKLRKGERHENLIVR